MPRASLLRVLLIAALALFASLPARAQTQVDLLLVLAVDASGSVNDVRFELQKQGYAAAFRHPNVLRAIRSGMQGSIAVTMTQWTGPTLQVQVVPWMLLKDQASVLAFASAIEKAPRELFSGGTSISGAIDHAMLLLPAAPFKGTKRVIDISGDGSNNRGRPGHAGARRRGAARASIINGLPILALEPWLDKYYFENVIGGPGSFMIPAESYEKFSDAVLREVGAGDSRAAALSGCVSVRVRRGWARRRNPCSPRRSSAPRRGCRAPQARRRSPRCRR